MADYLALPCTDSSTHWHLAVRQWKPEDAEIYLFLAQ